MVAALWVRSGCFGDYLAECGDDPDGGVFVAATGSLDVAVRGSWARLPSSDGFDDGRRYRRLRSVGACWTST